jgi:DHA2 family multidrug resistance protein-like MFS transporter
MSEEGTPMAARATGKEWIGLGVISLACVLYVMDLTVLHLAIPAISADLKPSSAQLLWIIDIYGFLVAGSLITMGTLGDRIGRRRLLMIGAGAFGVGSVAAAFSTSAEMLIATRALLGIAGATLAPSTLSLIRNMFLDPQQRTVAIGIWITSFSVGGAIGPLVGGVVLEYFWWGAVFLLALPVMAMLLVMGPRLLPEFKDPSVGRPDILSAAMALAAVLSVIYGLKQIAQDGLDWISIASISLGVALGVVFVRRQATLEEPFIDLKLFRIPSFSASLALYGFGIFLVFGGFLFLPQYLQLVVGLTPFEAGLWTLPWALGFVVGSNVTPILAKRFAPSTLMLAGFVFAAVGFAMLTQVDRGSGLGILVAGSVIFSLGTSPMFTLTNDLIIGSVPPERAGAAAGLSETSAEMGGAVGIAVFGSIGVAIYRGGVEVPDEVPGNVAAVARDTLGGAMDVAHGLPPDVAASLVQAAQASFTEGMHVGAIISAVGCLALTGLVVVIRSNERNRNGEGAESSEMETHAASPSGVVQPAGPDS